MIKEKHFYFYKTWFVFPFAIAIDLDCYDYIPPAKRVELHFLWWHCKWSFKKRE